MGLAVSAVAILLPREIAEVVGVGFALTVVVVMWWGSRKLPVDLRSAWRAMAVASLFFGLGAVTRSVHGDLVGLDYPLPSPADLLFVAGYGLFATAVLRFVRCRAGEAAVDAWIDALIPAAAGATLIWVTVVGPYVTDASNPEAERLLNGLYFVLTLLLLTVTLRLVVAPGVRVTSYQLLSTAVVLYFASDLLGTAAIANDWDRHVLTLTALPTATLFCMAVLHPSARHFADVPIDTEAQLGTTRLAVFGVALVIPPAVSVYELQFTESRGPGDLGFIIVSSVVMVSLVLVRMHRLVRARERIAGRERSLREASERLVAAGSVHALNTQAAYALTTVIDSAPVRATGVARLTDEEDYEVLNAEGRDQVEPGSTLSFRQEDQQRIGELLWGRHPDHPDLEIYGATFTLPEEGERLLFAFTDGPIDRHDRRAFESLGREVGLARRGLLAAQMIERSRTERRFESLVQHSSDIVIVTDPELTATYVSPSAEGQLGWAPDALVGKPVTDLVPKSERQTVLQNLGKLLRSNPDGARAELAVHDAEGRRHLIDLKVTDLTDHPEVGGYVLNGRDVTEATELRADLMHAAYHDALTDLPNRSYFSNQVAARLREDAADVGVLFVDLDDFKTINDGLGHAAGDDVIRTIAARIEDVAGPDDLAARLGGDEFALLLSGSDGGEHCRATAEALLTKIGEPVSVDGRQITTSASIGVVVADWSMSAEAVLRNADVAMYEAKAKGKSRFVRFEREMEAQVLDRLELKDDLRRAIDRDGELELDYQPLVDLADLRTTGVEALVRWRHPTRGRMPPGEFIALAEETGLIHPLGLWVLDAACTQLADWRRDPVTADLRMALNLSARQLPEPRLPEQIAQTIARHDLPPEQITIEITESVLMDESEFTARRLRELRDIGVSLAIDDFGTGYSSLGYLHRYPFDVLKIDRTFVNGLDHSSPNVEVAATIIDLAKRLGVRTIAEGIETEAELEKLISLGCQSGQGYFLSGPVDPGRISARLRAESNGDHEVETLASEAH